MSTLLNGFVVTFAPERGWERIRRDSPGLGRVFLGHTLPFALIPAVCWYVGVTSVGWSVAGGSMRLTPESALPMCLLFLLSMLAAVLFLGYMVRWMAASYGSTANLSQGVALISYTASPFFLAGVIGLYPVLWIDIVVGCVVACYCIYLLYMGTSRMLDVPPERGFLYASAVFAVALVSFVALMGATVVLWDLGPAPEYTY
jgi:hypothetical protein